MTKVALITGGQRGIGLGIAQALKDEGFRLAIVAEKNPGDTEVLNATKQLGPMAQYFQLDLSVTGSETALFDAIEERMGPVTTLVSNAGVPSPIRGDMLDLTPDNLDRVLAINLKGGFFLAQEAAKRMCAGPSDVYRSILFVTSVSADMVSVERADYCISKAAASMMSRLYAARLAEDGIGVFELRPGIIETDMTAAVRDRYDGLINNGLVPARRWGQPADIGCVVQALASGQMAYATGAVIPVDGGLSIQRL